MTRTRAFVTTSVFFLLSVSPGLPATEWHVAPPPLGSNKNPGTEEFPFATIQRGINASSDGDTVIVAEGTYVENIRFNGKNIVLRTTDPLDPTIVANTIIDGNQGNSVVTFSGTETEACVLSGFTIRNGRAESGGGICGGTRESPAHATIQNNAITGNSALRGGGGLYCCDGTIRNNTISQNAGGNYWGGGLFMCNGTIEDNLISANSSAEGGGVSHCDALIQNNTIEGNSATVFGGRAGGVCVCNGTIRNCIIWGNAGAEGPQLYASSNPINSCIQDWAGGGRGNISDDPLFVDAPGGDYHLQDLSPCIDMGQGFYWFAWPQRDLDGNCRLVGDGIDMGCYEYGSSPDADGDLLSDSDESAAGTARLRGDSDGDGLRDGLEILRRSDPLQSTPPGITCVPEDMPTIQQSLCLALDGDEIVVGPGRYLENLRFFGVDVILRSSDPQDNSVVESTILDGAGLASVVRFSGDESESCVLSGFTILGGRALEGAGICGGTEDKRTHATIENNIISFNSAEIPPGVMGTGGGLAFCDGTIRNNTISENTSGSEGAGLYECDGAIENNIVSGNSSAGPYGRGGGLARCDGVVRNNRIMGNSATGEYGRGGGLYFCDAIIQNNLIAGNWAKSGGGLNDCYALIQNNTIYDNSADSSGGGFYSCNGTIRNCIIWGNTAPDGPQLYSSSELAYCCIQGWTGGGEGNTALDPQFVDPDGPDNDPHTLADNDYRLSAGSPCIDAGINEHWMWTARDLDGNPRIVHARLSLTVDVDMGAYEYWSFRIAQALMEPTGGFQLTWNSRPDVVYVIWSCTDLTSGIWVQEQTVPSAGDSTSWTDPSPGVSRKFYRVQQL